MRNLKTVLLILILAVCSAGFFFLRLSALEKNQIIEPVVSYSSASKLAAKTLAVQAEVTRADTNSSVASEVCGACGKIHAGHVCAMYGGQKIMTLSDLPSGTVKSAVEKLPAEEQQHALLQLSRMNFRSSDEASVRVDANGFIYYVCAFTNAGIPEADNIPLAENATSAGETATAPLASYASVPVTNPPIYHSKPGSTKVLFLDFNGHDISNTAWNTEYGVSVWHCLPFDTDGDSTTFSDTEQRYIREMWERVAENGLRDLPCQEHALALFFLRLSPEYLCILTNPDTFHQSLKILRRWTRGERHLRADHPSPPKLQKRLIHRLHPFFVGIADR